MKKSSKIRVLEAIRQGQIGGGESHVLELVKRLDRTRFDPTVLSFTDGPMVDRLKLLKIPCHIIPSNRPFDIRCWTKIKSFLIRENFDLVHVHGTRAASNLLWATKSCKIPILYTIHGWSFHDNQSTALRRLRLMSEQYLTSKMDLNISVSESNQHRGKNLLRKFDSIVVNNGIDLEKFNPVQNYPDIREELNIPRNGILISFIARMTVQKDPLRLITAFKKVSETCENAHLLMVGEGELKKEAEDLVSRLDIQERVKFQNFRQDIPSILKASNIYCLPSLWEGLPIGLLEAMAMNAAVVATNVDGSNEIIKHNQNGLLVSTDSLDDLSTTLISLCVNTEKRNSLRIEGRQSVINNYNILRMVPRIESIYEEVFIKH